MKSKVKSKAENDGWIFKRKFIGTKTGTKCPVREKNETRGFPVYLNHSVAKGSGLGSDNEGQ